VTAPQSALIFKQAAVPISQLKDVAVESIDVECTCDQVVSVAAVATQAAGAMPREGPEGARLKAQSRMGQGKNWSTQSLRLRSNVLPMVQSPVRAQAMMSLSCSICAQVQGRQSQKRSAGVAGIRCQWTGVWIPRWTSATVIFSSSLMLTRRELYSS